MGSDEIDLEAELEEKRMRKTDLLRRGAKEPDFGKPPELEGAERLLRD